MSDTSFKNNELFSYQRRFIDKIKSIVYTRDRILVSIAVGFGRSTIIAYTLKELLSENKIRKILVITPNIQIVNQYLIEFNKTDLNSTKIIRNNEFVYENKNNILIITLNQFRKNSSILKFNFFDLIIIDECHLLNEKDILNFNNLPLSIVGFTTIPSYGLNDSISCLFDEKKTFLSYGISNMKLELIAEISHGVNYRITDLSNIGKYRFIRPRDIKDNDIIKSDIYLSEKSVIKNLDKILVKGDILLQNIFNFKKMAIVQEDDLPAFASNNLFIIRSKKINSEFLFNYLQSKTVIDVLQKQLEDVSYGNLIKHINLNQIKEIIVPIPFSEDHMKHFTYLSGYSDLKAILYIKNELKELQESYLKYKKEGGS
jgi:superfamily II DNA or RNA helicase